MIIIVMGVSGSGKTTVGSLLAQRLGWSFHDGDTYHPPENIARMAAGIPLDDRDRHSWLEALAGLVAELIKAGENSVIACSALKKAYREMLGKPGRENVCFVYLKGAYAVIMERMQQRSLHFMKPEMLQSQYETLEEPEGILTIDVTLPPDEIVDKIVEQLMDQKFALGIVGLGVMGHALANNFARNGYLPIGYIKPSHQPSEYEVPATSSMQEFAASIPAPRTILLMVPAGAAVDAVTASLKPYLQPGDLIIDGGNSHFLDTERRVKECHQEKLEFIGMGISGGEQGALWGPSLMPGGSKQAWPRVQAMFERIAAKAEDGQPCVDWMGAGGAGHYVKMVHNGIEYADMQLIAEIYDLLHRGAGIPNADLAGIFEHWNQGSLRSYLVEITAEILTRVDEETGQPLVDVILDEASQKGTGKWTSQNALDVGASIPTINAAVESRMISALKEERATAAGILGSARYFGGERQVLVQAAEQALYASKVTAYAQGLSLLQMASFEYEWELDLSRVAPIWRAGCIIRAALLEEITQAYRSQPRLPNLLLDATLSQEVLGREKAWREVVQTAVGLGIPMMATTASLGYFDAYRSKVLPANLTQAQRDYFGAHTYRRIDRPGSFHTDWET